MEKASSNEEPLIKLLGKKSARNKYKNKNGLCRILLDLLRYAVEQSHHIKGKNKGLF